MSQPPTSLRPPHESGGFGVFGSARAGVGYGGKRINLLKLAEVQKMLLWCLLAQMVLVITACVTPGVRIPQGATLAFALLWLRSAVFIATIALVARLAVIYGVHPVSGSWPAWLPQCPVSASLFSVCSIRAC